MHQQRQGSAECGAKETPGFRQHCPGHRNQQGQQAVLLLWRVTGHDEEYIQLLVFVPAILAPLLGELIRGQGHGLLALVAAVLADLAGYGGGVAGGHTGEGFLQEGMEASAVI